MPLEMLAYYTQSLVNLLGQLEQEPLKERLESFKAWKSDDVKQQCISIHDDFSSLLIFPSDGGFIPCVDGGDRLDSMQPFRRLSVEWNGRGAASGTQFLSFWVMLDNPHGKIPTISGYAVKALIVSQGADALELAEQKNMLIRTFTGVDTIYETSAYNHGLKADDERAVKRGIFDVSNTVIDGKLSHTNEIARLKQRHVANSYDSLYRLDNCVDECDSVMIKKYWAENKLVRDSKIITTSIACNGLRYTNYVQELVKEACTHPILMGWNNMTHIPFSNSPRHSLGRLSPCIIDTLVPMFAINYLFLMKVNLGTDLCVHFDTHALYIVPEIQIKAYREWLQQERNTAVNKREKARAERERRTKRRNPIKQEDLEFEIEL